MVTIILTFIYILIAIFFIYTYKKEIKKYQEEIESYKKRIESERDTKLYYWSMYNKNKNKAIYSLEVLEAVRYAVIKSHPDNGGKAEDFIKFNKCLKKLESEKNVNQN